VKKLTFADYKKGRGRNGGEWLMEKKGMEIYVRRAILVPGAFELANISVPADLQNKGIFSRFLVDNREVPLLIENVVSSILEASLMKNDYWTRMGAYSLGAPPAFVNGAYLGALKQSRLAEVR
jgi:hypothetical protein